MDIKSLLKKIYRTLGLHKVRSFISWEITPYGYFRNYILFPVCGFIRAHLSISKNTKEIKGLKEIHNGKRCFIVATGPSLTLEDVNRLKGEICFGVNSIFRIFEKTDWRPDYYMILDKGVCDKYNENGYLKPDEFSISKSFINSLCKKSCKGDKVVYLHTNWLKHVYKFGNLDFKYNPNLVFGLYDFYSVTHAAIQVAIYMGIKEIVLLGVDNNYLGSKTHFEKTDGDDDFDYQMALTTQNSMDEGYKAIKEIAEKQNVKIINATRGGRLEVFERVKLEDIVK